MGEIWEYECKDCKKKFMEKIGMGDLITNPKPTNCPFCKSKKLKQTVKMGYWD
jgi:putative FmdB family regulatory protein